VVATWPGRSEPIPGRAPPAGSEGRVVAVGNVGRCAGMAGRVATGRCMFPRLGRWPSWGREAFGSEGREAGIWGRAIGIWGRCAGMAGLAAGI
jgi:hypothetical protein